MPSEIDKFDHIIKVFADNIMRPSPLMLRLLNEDYIIPGRLLLQVMNALFRKSRKVREEASDVLDRLEKLSWRKEQESEFRC